jgi:hypothetical protein
MTETLKVVIPACIALVGTIITVVIGYRQWKRQQDASRYGTFITKKHSAYQELWEKLEEVHIKLRTEEVGLNEFKDLLREVNSYILKHSLYLEEEDRSLSNQYLKAVYGLKKIVMASGDEGAEEAMITTANIPLRVTQNAKEIRRAVSEVEEIRNSIITRFRKIVGGGLSS